MSLVVMLAASAFALDMGQAYTSRRQMQNAADAAAMAGSRALLKTRNPTTGAYLDPSNTVWTAVRDTATDNKADVAQVTCSVLRQDQTVIAPCTPSTGWILGSPAGVKVTAGVTNKTAFAKVINKSTLTAAAKASALLKPLISAKGAPFIVCGLGDHTLSKVTWTADPLNPDLTSLPINVLVNGTLNPLAVGHVYAIQGSGSTIATCATEAAFDGKSANGSTSITLPSWQTGTNGNGNDSGVYDTVAGAVACIPPNFTDCDLVLPIADAGAPGYQLHVVAFGVFHVTGIGTGNPKYAGRLLTADAPVTRGQGGSGTCGVGQACVIKLVS
jgi:hypothetical protein